MGSEMCIRDRNTVDGIQWIRLKGTKYIVKFESDSALELDKVYYVGGARVHYDEYSKQVMINKSALSVIGVSTTLSNDIVEVIRSVKPTGYSSTTVNIVSDGTFWVRQGDIVAQDPAVMDYYRKFDEKVARQMSSKDKTKTRSGKIEKTDVKNRKSGAIKTQTIVIPYDVKVNPNSADQNTTSVLKDKPEDTLQTVGSTYQDPEYNEVLSLVRYNYPELVGVIGNG